MTLRRTMEGTINSQEQSQGVDKNLSERIVANYGSIASEEENEWIAGNSSSKTSSLWYKMFDQYGGNTFVSTTATTDDRARRRLNLPLLLFVSAALALVFYLHRHRGQELPTSNTGISSNFGDGSKSANDTIPSISKQTYDTASVSLKKKQKMTEDPACKGNNGCTPLGLIGNCCPTDEGKFLDCCSA